MAKAKQMYFCQECGFETVKWQGQCPACKSWNTFVEEKLVVGAGKHSGKTEAAAPTSILDISTVEDARIGTGMKELDRVLGGGIVKGSLTLVGGDPGIGKSTILLQVCRNLSKNDWKVLYASGEESLQQIKMRAERIGDFSKDMLLLSETNWDAIEGAITKIMPDVVVIDSIQTVYLDDVSSGAGSVSQVREVTGRLMRVAKQLGIAVFIVGHVTKEGSVAGPRTLEHMVDTVLYFEGEKNALFRVLRGVKNRFGSTNEIGVFEMKDTGLCEVDNPSQVMLDGRPLDASGSVVICAMEGTRPLLIEMQALVCQTNFNLPRRTSVGIDYNRVNLLMAVLEKREGMMLAGSDAYVNLAGGMKVSEPALDLGIVAALISSFKNIAVNPQSVFFGEVGLAGEIRGVTMAEQRVREAAKMGFTTCVIPKSNVATVKNIEGMRVIGVSKLSEVIEMIS
ncbi:MAG: DNA repair protein RadA [Eubacteriales bacterium]|nr:DNA repair protein RadA [Eubacteriales bacterium]